MISREQIWRYLLHLIEPWRARAAAVVSRLNLGLHQRDINVIWDLAPHDFSILLVLAQ